MKTNRSDRYAPRLHTELAHSESDSDSSHHHHPGSHSHHHRSSSHGHHHDGRSNSPMSDKRRAMEQLRKQRRMTAEEREAALAKMKDAGEKRYAEKLHPTHAAEDETSHSGDSDEHKVQFLQNVVSTVYASETTLQDRINRNVHHLERPTDD